MSSTEVETTDPGIKPTVAHWWAKTHILSYVQHALIILVVWVGSGLAAARITEQTKAQVTDWGELHDPVETFDYLASCKATFPNSPQVCMRLNSQTIEIQSRISAYRAALIYYGSDQIAFASVGYLLGILAAVCGVAVSRSGWADCDFRLLTAFGAVASAFAFYEGYPSLLQFQKNIDGNSDAFLYHVDLLGEVRTFCSVGSSQSGITDPAAFSIYIESRVATLNEIYFAIDESQVGSGGKRFIESQDLNNYKPGKEDASGTVDQPSTPTPTPP